MKHFLRKFTGLSLRSRIIIIFTVITVLLVFFMLRVSYYTVREIYLNQVSDQSALLVRLISHGLDSKYLPYLEPGMEEGQAHAYYFLYLKNQAEMLELTRAFIFNRNLQVLVDGGNSSSPHSPDPALVMNRFEITQLAPGETGSSLPFKGEDGGWYMWVFTNLDGQYFLGAQVDASRLARIDRLSLIFWGIGFLGVVLTGLAGLWLASSLSRPIQALVSYSQALGKGDFSASIPSQIRGELSVLAAALDKMRNDLKRTHQEKEEILAQIAHEIRNPLGGMELLSGLIKEEVRGNPKAEEYAGKILKEIGGLKQLISAYLSYSRPMPASPQWVDVHAEVEEIRKLFQKSLSAKKADWVFQGNCRKVWFDPHQFKQILLNLVGNSLDVLPDRGRIEIRVSENEKYWEIEIGDTGPGISSEQLMRVFEPFYSTKSNGSGLGLAICRKLCAENNATISVQNKKEGGCVFRIRIKMPLFEAKV
ncbi:MAG: hypothetical protein Kow0042_18140 [Calditrichia bacterium]